ncbi:MAG: aldehyde dehydrogenase [Christensenellaceae bacterium]|nr:aldehyde dehydrogenase [Christensenellaceae bacterium]
MKQQIDAMRAYFAAGATLDVDFRIRQLKKLRSAIAAYEGRILAALREDLGKADFEGYATEIGVVYSEISHTLKHIRRWVRPKKVGTPIVHFPSASKICPEPLGVVLIMSPWNYPLQLALAPLVAAIAAGNCAVVKPSRYAPATAAVVEQLLTETFPPEYVRVYQGGSQMNTALLEIPFDHIFFTGSVNVGKVVMTAAAKHLCPVTLELGGKSPVIVDGGDMALAAKRIMWGKCINSGQTCVAPDYVLVRRQLLGDLVAAMKAAVTELYGEEPLKNPEYGKIISRKHFDRLCGLMGSGQPAFGGRVDAAARKIEPTVLLGAGVESAVMGEEIFGPLLPVIPVDSLDEAIDFVRGRPKPLALYLFTADKAVEKRVLREVSFGGGCINDVVVHLTNPNMHFGGVGESGMGQYHGIRGFETFSHLKSVLKKGRWLDIPVRYPPYGNKLGLVKKIMK